MSNEELKSELSATRPGAVFEEGGEWLVIQADPEEWLWLARQLHDRDSMLFDYLFCLTCVDWKTHLTMVYHLTSTTYRHNLVVKVQLNRAQPETDSVYSVWKTADFHEREVYELFGVQFRNHPDLRKLILPDDFEGFPLRKDFEDPVNMIRL